jgi:hypothetical protein
MENAEIDLSIEQWELILLLLEQAATITDRKYSQFEITINCIKEQLKK